ncbi:hypothetical protein [Paenibacillus elgii]|uniref:hypothetical protein n=1 Tax=Paenibacillus elgii TaxID=189691 RepID=UPI000FDA98BD|nr:hypothetical protein [Paenibacillus elgii]NEN84903.1 hypothetical protein [Paenibacillus elgii]
MSLWFKEKAVQKIVVVLFVLALSTGLGTREAFAYVTYNCSDEFYTCQGAFLPPGYGESQTRSIYVKEGMVIDYGYLSLNTTSESVYSTTVSLVSLYDGVVKSEVVVPPEKGAGGYYTATRTDWYSLKFECETDHAMECYGDGYLRVPIEP